MLRKFTIHAVALLAAALTTSVGSAQPVEQRATEEQVQIVAEKMCCKGCAQKVSGQIYAVRGVRSVGVDLATHTVTISLPPANAATLGNIWQAAVKGDGGPTSLSTSSATYAISLPQDEDGIRQAQQMGTTQHLVIDNLHCKGCAQKIAAQLYAVKGVTAVSVDMPRETLIVETDPRTSVSPWLIVDAVTNAKERALEVRGNYGSLAITWATVADPKTDHQAQHTDNGGIQR